MRKTHEVTMVLAVCCLLASGLVGAISARTAAGGQAKWTLAFYLDSDNDLDPYAAEDVDEMKMIGSTQDVNVLIFWDRYDVPAYAYKVLLGGLQELTDFSLNGIEVNMGDPATLDAWVTYTTSRFPSTKYALMGWDHGDDVVGCMLDDHIPETGVDLLTHQEIVTALAGFHIDVLLYGACVLQEIEVLYEYYAGGLNIDYIVANEGYDPMDGFPYDTILANLTATPTQSPLEFSKMCVDEYIDYYQYVGCAYSQAVTLSVVQTNRVGEVVTDLGNMVDAVMLDMWNYGKIVSAASGHANLPWSEQGWDRIDDMSTFVDVIHDKSLDPKQVKDIDPAVVEAVVSSSESLLASLEDAIVYCRNVKAMETKGCIGIGIYFPPSRDAYQNNKWVHEGYVLKPSDIYPLMAFAGEGWFDFLNAYWDLPKSQK